MKLQDLGERTIIRELVLPHLRHPDGAFLADDAAVVALDEEWSLLVTTDAGPKRSFLRLFGVGDLADFGHYCATMSISDIVAMGGQPMGVVAACIMPDDCSSAEFESLISGLVESCREHGTMYLGGDTKEGVDIRIVTSAIGKVRTSDMLTRRGARDGNLLCVTGCIGGALASYVETARARKKGTVASGIRRPKAPVHIGSALSSRKLATSCTDMSDGPLAAARELGEQNEVVVHIDADSIDVVRPRVAGLSNDLWNSIVFNVGGDYELMFTVAPENRTSVEDLGARVCGRVENPGKQPPGVTVSGMNAPTLFHPWEHFSTTKAITKLLDGLL